MRTLKKESKKNNKHTRKTFKGGNDDDIPCGINEKGESTKCPPNHRCEIVDGKKLCKPSIEIKITNNKDSISLFVPWKRHKKWLKYYDVLNKQIALIKALRSDRGKNRNKLMQENKELIFEIKNKDRIKDMIGANNSDELIIQKVLLMHVIEDEYPSNKQIENGTSDNVSEIQVEQEDSESKEEKEVEQEDSESKEEKEVEQEEPIIKEALKNIQDKIGLIPSDTNSKEYNKALQNKELLHNEYLSKNNEYDFLYPELDDPNFNIKIAKRKEFYDTKYDGTIYNVKEQAEKMCHAKFELMPHQLFVRNFMSIQTPYNSLLLYHGLGTGKTCSAIGISEEMRSYIKNIGSAQKIIVIASPNVQSNFIYQLFDERKLELQGGIWNLNTCVGNELLKELNPMQLQNLSKEKVISQIKGLIKQYYIFMGYGEFANFIKRKTMVDENSGLSDSEKRIVESDNIKKYFNNRLIIIDEVHNISAIQSNKQNKKTSSMLMHVCKHAKNMRLLLLSATPMYNSYREIIWLTNLLNIVNKKSLIREEDVFDKDGNFIEGKTTDDGRKIEGGKELLKRKLTGYISYVRGENPYTFPYRVYPEIFDEARIIKKENYPKIQMNKRVIDSPLKYLPVYANKIGDYQKKVYEFIMQHLRNKVFITPFQKGERNMPNFENMESFGYTLLTNPIQSLNIVYPSEDFDTLNDNIKEKGDDEIQVNEEEELNVENYENIINTMVGSQGLNKIMTYKITKSPYMLRNKFEYKPEVVDKYGRIFAPDYIARYSDKISNICKIIKKSKGMVMIYSQYIDSGVVPIALALEEMGFNRYGTSSHTTSLFNNSPTDPIDSISLLPKSEHIKSKEYTNTFYGAKYVMITGDKHFSPNNAADLKKIIHSDNKYGEKIKVVLITKAAAEGLDFKNIRQLHVLEPWYNASRLEQIIGRTVRNLSHCALPFEERNVEIYLHGTQKDDEETADLYVYRYAENKAVQIGKVTRILKENAVDCILNIDQTNLTLENLTQQAQGQEIELKTSSMKNSETIIYQIGDKPYTEICDYMDSCNFICNPNEEIKNSDLYKTTYNEQFAKMNYSTIVKRIREAFREHFFYERKDLIDSILMQHSYPIEHIDYALTQFVNNKSEHIIDKFGRYGYLINKEKYYVFQPFEITDEYASIYEREVPIDLKYDRLEMELPMEKNDQDGKKTKEELQKNDSLSSKMDIDDIIKDLDKELKYVTHEREIRIKLSEKYGNLDSINKRSLSQLREQYNLEDSGSNWYKNAGKIYDILINNYKISEKLLEKFFVHHYLDGISYDNHLIVATNIYNFSISSDAKYYSIIKEYYDKKIITNGEKRGVLLPLNGKNTLYMFRTDNELSKAKPTELNFFNKQIQETFAINNANINEVFGFMSIFKDEILFKLKTKKDDKSNKGVVCEKLGKVDILHRIKPIINNNPYKTDDWPMYNSDFFDKLIKQGLCVLVECIMRYYNEYDSKQKWFLDITESLASEITQK